MSQVESEPLSGVLEVEAPDGSIVEFPAGTDRKIMASAMQQRFPAPTSRMIQINAPDGSIVQFPDGTSDDVIKGVMAKNYPAPAPDLMSVGAAAQRELVEKLGVIENRATTDVAAFAGPNPSFMERLRSLVMGAPAPQKPDVVDQSFISTIMDQGAYLPRGMRRGLANIAGLPVDLVNGAMSLAGAPVSTKPLMGSKFIDDALGGFGAIPDVRPPATTTERVLGRIGEEVGAAAVPVGGAIAKAGQVGVEGARKLPFLARMFVEPAAINPAAFARKEGATAFAAGTGAAAANEVSRAAGLSPEGGAYQTMDILGALGGAGALGAARMVGKPINDVRRAIWDKDSFSNDTVKENTVDRILNNSQIVPKVEGQPIDTRPLVDAIMEGRRVDATIPGFKDSLADRTGDSGIATLEYGRQSGPNAGDFVQRRADNTDVVAAVMNANAPKGSPAALRSELELERTRRLTDSETHALNAQDEATRAAAAVTPQSTAAQRGNTVRTALEDARGAARDRTEAAYANADVARLPIDATELSTTIDNAIAPLTEVERGLLPEGTLARVRRLGQPADAAPTPTGILDEYGNPITRAPDAPPPVDMKEATDLLSELSRLERAALADPRAEKGGRNAARVIGQVSDAVEGFVGRSLPEADRAALAEARRAKFNEAEAFTRQGDPVAQAVSRYEGGQPRVRDDRVAGMFMNPQAMDRLFAQADTPQTRAAIREEVLSRGDTTSAQRIRDFTGSYGEQVDRFPGLRAELDAAATAREAEAAAQGTHQRMTRELGTPDRPGTSIVGKYLAYGDERSQDALKSVLASKQPAQAMDEMLNFVGNKPEAIEGARKSFWDLMESRSRSNGETTKAMDGKQPWMPNRLKNFLDDPANAVVAERLWRDNPEHVGNVRKIAEELQGVDLRARGKANNTSGTAQSISNVLTPETLQSRFYAYKRGQTSLGFMLTALGSIAARRVVRGAQGEAMEKLLDKALLDPDLAAQLLKEHNPANRAALARTAKAYLGNEASTLTDILDGQEKDPVKDAIMR
jgi:hypothetical protein